MYYLGVDIGGMSIKCGIVDENGVIIGEKRTIVTPTTGGDDCVKGIADLCRDTVKANGADLAFVQISAFDKDGYPVENARNRVRVEVEGAGRLVGLDNGDSTDFDEHKGKSRRLFGGKLLAMIGTKKTAGEIKVTVTSPGLPADSFLPV